MGDNWKGWLQSQYGVYRAVKSISLGRSKSVNQGDFFTELIYDSATNGFLMIKFSYFGSSENIGLKSNLN